MKKLFAVMLVVLFLPVSALAEQDPIIGNWYMLLEVKGSILESSIPDCTQMFLLLTFEENGNIIWSEQDYNGETVNAIQPSVFGQWKKEGSEYSVSFVSVGTEKAFFEDNLLYVAAFSPNLYFGFRKIVPIDLYNETYRK